MALLAVRTSASAADAVSPGVQLQLQAAGTTVYGAQEDLDDGATVPLRIADRTWELTVKDPDGPGLSLPVTLAVLGISLAALLGAVFLLWADVVARTVFDPRELPLGIVTAVVGAPLLVLLVRRLRTT